MVKKWNRVVCEPTVINGYIPDLVVWDDIDQRHPPEDKKWPMLWVCELKVNTADTSSLRQRDISKLKDLLKEGVARYACYLNFVLCDDRNNNIIDDIWKKDEECGVKLWERTIRAHR